MALLFLRITESQEKGKKMSRERRRILERCSAWIFRGDGRRPEWLAGGREQVGDFRLAPRVLVRVGGAPWVVAPVTELRGVLGAER